MGPVVGTSAGTVGWLGVGVGVLVGVATAVVELGVGDGLVTAWWALVQPLARQATTAIVSRPARIREWCQSDRRSAGSKSAAVENLAQQTLFIIAEKIRFRRVDGQPGS